MNREINPIDEAARTAGLAGKTSIETFPIPCAEGHDVVYGLAAGAGNEIYLAASNEFSPGLCAVVYAFDIVTRRFRVVIDVEQATGFDPASGLMPHSKIHLALSSTRKGRVFAATHFTAPGAGQSSFEPIAAFRGKYSGCFLLEYDPRGDGVINHGRLARGEGARISCLDERNQQYYFLSYPRNHLFRYDYAARELHDLGRMGQENSFGLEVDEQGDVYSSDDRGRILRYSRQEDRVEETNLFVPLAPGRRSNGNYIRRMTRGLNGVLYGFGNKGMRLFGLDPRAGTMDDFGAILGREGNPGYTYPELPPAKAMVAIDLHTLLIAFGGDGIYADEQPVPTLVQYDLRERRATDGGRFIDPQDGTPAWIPQCALAVPQARAVFFGLQQTAPPLRLWRVNLPSLPGGVTAPDPAPLARHVAFVRSRPFGVSVEGAGPLPFMRRGHVRMHALGWPGEDRVIGPGETAIAAFCLIGETVYGVTTGRAAHLFSFRPYQQARFTENHEVHPWDLGRITPVITARAKLFHDVRRGRLLIATESASRLSLAAFSPGAELGHSVATYHSLPAGPPVAWPACPFQPLANIARTSADFENLTYWPEWDEFVSTREDGQLVRVGYDGASRPVNLGAALMRPALLAVGGARLFAVTRHGNGLLLAAGERGEIVICRTFPELAGEPSCLAVDGAGECVAIGTTDGRLESVDCADPLRRVTFKLPHRWKVRALAWDRRGRLFGFYGEDDGIGEAFVAVPRTGAIHEIGILQVSSEPRYWMCHRCDAIVPGVRGEMFFGESDRLAHLFSVIDPDLE